MLENTGVSDNKLEDKITNKKDDVKKNISTLNPIDDFKEMVNYKYEDLATKAMEQMCEIIQKFINESFKGSYYIKAIDCLKVLRDACIDEDEAHFFNKFLESLKSSFQVEKFMDWWKLVIDNRITLISKRENKTSMVSDDEAKKFFEALNKKDVILSIIPDIDEDLIADID